MLLAAMSLFCFVGVRGMSPERETEIAAHISAASAAIQTLECDFEQSKEVALLDAVMKSSGRLYYMAGGLLRWEYTEPYAYLFVMNGDKVMVGNGANSSVIDIRTNRMFRKISEIIVSGIDGSAIGDTDSFGVSFAEEGDWVVVEMTPLRKDMKGFFSGIRLYFSPEDWMVGRIVLEEATGDSSVITLSGRKLNGKLDETVFEIH